MGIKHPLHRKKLVLAIKAINAKQDEKSAQLDHIWVTRKCLDSHGIVWEGISPTSVKGQPDLCLSSYQTFLKSTKFHHRGIDDFFCVILNIQTCSLCYALPWGARSDSRQLNGEAQSRNSSVNTADDVLHHMLCVKYHRAGMDRAGQWELLSGCCQETVPRKGE